MYWALESNEFDGWSADCCPRGGSFKKRKNTADQLAWKRPVPHKRTDTLSACLAGVLRCKNMFFFLYSSLLLINTVGEIWCGLLSLGALGQRHTGRQFSPEAISSRSGAVAKASYALALKNLHWPITVQESVSIFRRFIRPRASRFSHNELLAISID